ncbi:glycoprotein Xg isoform X6 [Sminthopsis crassicaudata]|uniref:glycoprotein Xg isoform X6 n=1 Tax=Sminthopsis crassicaudata TaxID=9301 RepID=UPI003D6883E7
MGRIIFMYSASNLHFSSQDDFDLADALDDTDIYPKPNPPNRPQPGIYDNPGGNVNDLDLDDGRYPPKPRPPAGGGGYHSNNFGNTHGGGGYNSNYNNHGGGGYNPSSHYGNNYGGGGYSNYGNTHGDSVARIVSPIVSVVVVSLIGAATSYFAYNRRRNCCRTNEPENV